MAKNVFISYRFVDGVKYKNELSKRFDSFYDTVDYSEDEDRSTMSDEYIRQYLYGKLRRSSVTIVLLTPQALNHRKNWYGQYNDWMYDEIRFSLEDRGNNRTNGLIAVYTPETANQLVTLLSDGNVFVKDVDNLFRRNMMNIKTPYKTNPTNNVYDRDWDSYCSLLSWQEFTSDIGKYIEIATQKRGVQYKYDIVKRL